MLIIGHGQGTSWCRGATVRPTHSPFRGFSTEIEIKHNLDKARTGWRDLNVSR